MSINNSFVAPKPKENEPWDVAIIGSGPSSLTAAIYTTRGAASTLILGGEKWGGQLMLTTTVDNYPGFPKGIQGPELMQKMREQAERFGAEFVAKKVVAVIFDNKPFLLKTGDEDYKANSVIIATGAETRWLGVPGEEKLRGRGVSSCAPCDAPFFKDKEVVVVGGGDVAMEEALVLTKYAKSVTMIHRRDEFKASQAMQEKVFENNKIKILWDSEVVEMMGEEKLDAVKIKTKKDSKKTKNFEGETKVKGDYFFWQKKIDGMFVAVGHIPATDVFEQKIELDEKGYVKLHNATHTDKKGVFVAGDVHDYRYRQAITAAGYGCMAGMDTIKYLDKLKLSQ
ncbi:thioredoxin-disulfide reductase [Patescibacteria group bacterium]